MFDFNTIVLVVDDMTTMRKIVQKALKEIGFSNFVEARMGKKAWEVLNDSPVPVGLVISIGICRMRVGLLKRVRADGRYKGLPFVLLTAESELEQVKEAVLAGVDNYIVKPFTPAMLKQKLEETHKKVSA